LTSGKVTPFRRNYCFCGCGHIEPADWYPTLPWDRVVQRALDLGQDCPSLESVLDIDGTVLEWRVMLDLGYGTLCAFCLDENEEAEWEQAEEIFSEEW